MPRYLVVDDSPTIRLMIKMAIKQATGSEDIAEADDAATAMAKFQAAKFDAVFLDMMLAGSDRGLDVLRAMLVERPEAKVILLTGLARDHPDVAKAISDGAFAYVEKPVRGEAVRKVLQTLDAESGRLGRIR